MANFADVAMVTVEGRSLIVAVTSAFKDGVGGGCWWTLHTLKGQLVNHGLTRGFDGHGMGSAHSSMKAGKAAARRMLKRQIKNGEI